ncbi:hypothetical protein Nepgr_025688 [Nepenthes gracilis]|uniref:SHSP domain-containing protein n=1 Tax=Nepenthes gracilis TaxID=150966 RepID=A0AAD3T6I1_NEPGR|nr:hypothetical protein Nepgr_025688 [Nepenthes gracilis]
MSVILVAFFVGIMALPAKGLMPLARPLCDFDDPFRVLEQSPFPWPDTHLEALAMARADWKETEAAHIISLDVPGMRREDVKIEVEENRVLRVSGERRADEEAEGVKWHRAERTSGKFWRQFRLPGNADSDHIKANLDNGVLRITVPKIAKERRRQAKVITIAEEEASGGGEDIKAVRADA